MADRTEPSTSKPTSKRRRDRRGAAQFESHPIPGAVIANHAPARAKEARPDADEMWALVYDVKEDPWDKTTGFRKARVERPTLDEDHDPLDANRAIVRVLYTGVCGSDAGIWFRTSFKGMIHDSLKSEGKTTRVIGHEVFGEVVEVGSHAHAHFELEKGDLVSAESHIVCGKCHQCLIGQTHVCVNERIIGISVGPLDRKRWPKAYKRLPST